MMTPQLIDRYLMYLLCLQYVDKITRYKELELEYVMNERDTKF